MSRDEKIFAIRDWMVRYPSLQFPTRADLDSMSEEEIDYAYEKANKTINTFKEGKHMKNYFDRITSIARIIAPTSKLIPLGIDEKVNDLLKAAEEQDKGNVELKNYRRRKFCMDFKSNCWMSYEPIVCDGKIPVIDVARNQYPQCKTCSNTPHNDETGVKWQISVWSYNKIKELEEEEEQTFRYISRQRMESHNSFRPNTGLGTLFDFISSRMQTNNSSQMSEENMQMMRDQLNKQIQSQLSSRP